MTVVNKVFEKYKKDIEVQLNNWLVENEYHPVSLDDEQTVEQLFDEVFCLMAGTDLHDMLDEIDNCGLLGEADSFNRVDD